MLNKAELDQKEGELEIWDETYQMKSYSDCVKGSSPGAVVLWWSVPSDLTSDTM